MKFEKICKIRKSIKKVFKSKNPADIALSISFGIFIGIFVPAGFQTIAAVPLALIAKRKVLLVLGATYISNPLTIIPIYIFSLNIGCFITGNNSAYNNIHALIVNPSIGNIFIFLSNSLYPILIGSFIIGITLAILSYAAIYFGVNAFKWLSLNN